jgi:trimethylamine:corrinoid methyltransferase-like protein
MSTENTPPSAGARRPRKAGRNRVRAVHPAAATFITRSIPPYEMLDEDQLITVEKHADRILEEIGMEIRVMKWLFASGKRREPISRATLGCASLRDWRAIL